MLIGVRIIGGVYRSRGLEAPAGLATRPTSDRLRETLFNVLASRIEGAGFLDLYAGSGAVGLEALSRGATRVTFVEREAKALRVLRENLTGLGIRDAFSIQARSAAAFFRLRSAETFDVVFLDPPWDAESEYETTLGILGGAGSSPGSSAAAEETPGHPLLNRGAIVIAEHRRRVRLEEHYGSLERTRLLEQGDAALSFYRNCRFDRPAAESEEM